MDAYTFIKTASLDYNLHNFSIIVNVWPIARKRQGKPLQSSRLLLVRFLDVNLTFAGGILRTKKIQNAIIRKLPVVLDQEAELEKLGVSEIIKKRRERLEKIGIMVYDFFQKFDL